MPRAHDHRVSFATGGPAKMRSLPRSLLFEPKNAVGGDPWLWTPGLHWLRRSLKPFLLHGALAA